MSWGCIREIMEESSHVMGVYKGVMEESSHVMVVYKGGHGGV